MRQAILMASLLMAASSVISTACAQQERAAAGGVSFTAYYPADRAGVLIRDAKWILVANQNPANIKTKHGIAASLSYGVVPAKVVAEYTGERSPSRVEAALPILCICHFLSLPGEPVLVKLHPKNGMRELDGGKMIVYPFAGGSKAADAAKSDLIPVDISQPDPHVWLIRPQVALDPGEYALVLGTGNMSIFAFAVGPRSTGADTSK